MAARQGEGLEAISSQPTNPWLHDIYTSETDFSLDLWRRFKIAYGGMHIYQKNPAQADQISAN